MGRLNTPRESRFVTLLGLGLVLIETVGLRYSFIRAYNDLSAIEESRGALFLFGMVFSIIIMSVPVILAIGFLPRKNWGRIGMMLLSLGPYWLVSFHMLKYGGTYPYQLFAGILYLAIFFILKSNKVKSEFISESPPDLGVNDKIETA